MDIGRKVRIGLGAILIIIAFFTGGSLYMAGILVALTGIFNLCPTCANGACKIDPKKESDKDVNPSEKKL